MKPFEPLRRALRRPYRGVTPAGAAGLPARSGRGVLNLRGGVMARRRAGLPLVTPSGRR